MKLFLRTTNDKYELPIAVADSADELARMLGKSKNAVSSAISHGIRGWYRLEIDDGEDERVPEGVHRRDTESSSDRA